MILLKKSDGDSDGDCDIVCVVTGVILPEESGGDCDKGEVCDEFRE